MFQLLFILCSIALLCFAGLVAGPIGFFVVLVILLLISEKLGGNQ